MSDQFELVKSSRDLYVYKIKAEMELLPFLYKALSNRSRNSVKSILGRGQVSINNKTTTQFNDPLYPGNFVSILKNEAAKRIGALIGIDIVYEDDDLIMINKEEGLLSVATEKEKDFTVHNQMMNYVRHQHPRNRIFIVHRLDQETSGLMMLAKSTHVQNVLQENWHNIVHERSYLALVEGEVEKSTNTIRSWLKETKTFYVYSSHDETDGLHAVTHYKKLKSNGEFSLLNVQLETGRKNQIRVHMKDIGHPVVGDKKYGSTKNVLGRLGLHAHALAFKHPVTNEDMRFEVKAPRGFYARVK